jgi:hypothetical protein
MQPEPDRMVINNFIDEHLRNTGQIEPAQAA